MNRYLLFISISFLLMSCGFFGPNNSFQLTIESNARMNGKELYNEHLDTLNTMFNILSRKRIEVYSKPDYVIDFENNHELNTISVFLCEEFVYQGDFLDAWTERMEGKVSEGFRLSKSLRKYLKENF
ncbi:MAG: hypothetical protein JXB49_02885 [Bacteroidales bacterium]|nr:hypothetical protein [Bacteroidales bacterium]